ncbi:tyrosine-type recombinase/integrase [Halorubrum halophilum]|uniref:tyrosine-type recombinase/integrase n=1 Tax=Halorubrum halophilum TaxID=413816 RepID=UPI0006799811|nr:site-specific integrase [Halorubrum halophilum]
MADDKHWLKPNQVEAMRDATREGRHPTRDDAIITLLYDTGLRRGELSRSDHAMLDLEDGLLRLPTSVQKDYPNDSVPPPVTFQLDRDGSLRTVATLQEYLEGRVEDAPALVSSQKAGRMTGKGINDVVQRAAQRADIRPYCFSGRGHPEDVSAHTLRHSVAWRMLRVEDGNTLYDVRNRLRHSSILTTEREYDHFETV